MLETNEGGDRSENIDKESIVILEKGTLQKCGNKRGTAVIKGWYNKATLYISFQCLAPSYPGIDYWKKQKSSFNTPTLSTFTCSTIDQPKSDIRDNFIMGESVDTTYRG